jgi:hypothetical protein
MLRDALVITMYKYVKELVKNTEPTTLDFENVLVYIDGVTSVVEEPRQTRARQFLTRRL